MRWEEAAEAEGHTRLHTRESYSQTSGGGRGGGRGTADWGCRELEALRLSFRAPREAVSRRSRRRRGESGGSSGGTPSPCGSAQAAAEEEATEKMPALHPVRLWALLALWLCRAAPARGEYRARGCCPRTPVRAPPPPPGPATWGDRPPSHFGPTLCLRRPGSAVGADGGHSVPESLDIVGAPGARPLPRAPRRRLLPSARGLTHASLAGGRPGSEAQKLPFSGTGVLGVWADLPFWFRVSWG